MAINLSDGIRFEVDMTHHDMYILVFATAALIKLGMLLSEQDEGGRCSQFCGI